MASERETVTVSFDSVEALAEPQFVLEYEGRIFVTVAVVEFDPNDPDMEDEDKSDLQELQRLLDGPRSVSGTVAGEPREAAAMAQSESRGGGSN